MREKIVYLGRKSRKKVRKVMEGISSEQYMNKALDSRLGLIEALIPIGLMKLQEELTEEVTRLAGRRYERGGYVRYGSNMGSVALGGQRVGVEVPRVRDLQRGIEIPLESYRRLHKGDTQCDSAALARVLKGISCRDYESASMAVPEAFGLSSSTISRRFIKASNKQLKALQERHLGGYDIVAILLDGKTFSGDDLIIAIGVTIEGQKIVLGFIEAKTENDVIVKDFLRTLLSRGLNIDEGVLAVVDGSKGLISGVRKVFADKVLIQRCQWHKRENIVSYVSKVEQTPLRQRLQRAYERPTYAESKSELMRIRVGLKEQNLSAVASMDEGLEETLTLHRLEVFSLLGKSLKTTNCLESINAMVEQRCGKVDYWKNSSQRHRWLASTLLDIEPRLNRIRGHQHLCKLRDALKKELKIENCEALREAA